MVYRRASRRQLEYIRQLAEQTGAELPWGFEGYSLERATKLINQLQKKLTSEDKPAAAADQLSLL